MCSSVLGILVLALLNSEGHARFSGAPAEACTSLKPGIPHGTFREMGNGGYVISTPSSLPRRTSGTGFNYQAGIAYIIILEKVNSSVPNFLGFALQAVSPGTTNLLGSFSSPGGSRKYMSCGNGEQSVTHNTGDISRTSEEFTWNSPNDRDGSVDFRYTVVRTVPVYFYALVASEGNYVVRQRSTTQPRTIPSVPPTTIASPLNMLTTQPVTDQFPVDLTFHPPDSRTSEPPLLAQTTNAENYATTEADEEEILIAETPGGISTPVIGVPLQTFATPTAGPEVKFAPVSLTRQQVEAILKGRSSSEGGEVIVREPSDCERTQCKTYVSIRTWPGSPGVLDIYLEGRASTWVAVGFTPTSSMRAADVIACVRYPLTEGVLVLDSWNVPDENFNVADEDQEDVAINFGQYEDGRISCHVNRSVIGTNPTRDFSLNGDYYLLYGVSNTAYSVASPGLVTHEYGASNIPRVTADKQNVVKLTSPEADSGVGSSYDHLLFISFFSIFISFIC